MDEDSHVWACANGPCHEMAIANRMPAGWLAVADDRASTLPAYVCGWRCLAELADALAGVLH